MFPTRPTPLAPTKFFAGHVVFTVICVQRPRGEEHEEKRDDDLVLRLGFDLAL